MRSDTISSNPSPAHVIKKRQDTRQTKNRPSKALASVPVAQELMVMFSAARTQASLRDFEAHFDAIVKRFPAAVKYLLTVYEDRKRWAEYSTPLLFTVGPPTTLRVECEVSLLEKYADDLGRPADFPLPGIPPPICSVLLYAPCVFLFLISVSAAVLLYTRVLEKL